MFRTSFLCVMALSLCVTAASADTARWWNTQWRFRTTVTRPTPWRQSTPRPVEVAVDFPLLLAHAGIEGEFDPASLRVVDRGTHRFLPFVRETEFDARRQRQRTYLAWMSQPRIGEVGRYDIYFDTVERRLGDVERKGGLVPPENLIANSGFDKGNDGEAADWEITPAKLVSFGTFEHTTGDRSLRVHIDEDTPADVPREVTLTQRVDVREFAGQEMVFECDLLAEQAKYGCPVSIEVKQIREDGSYIRECAVEPRWLSLEMAEGQLVQLSERGRFSHEAVAAEVRVRLKLSVRDADTGQTVTGPESHFTVWLDRFVMRPGERWPWPGLSHAGFASGALSDAPINRSFEFTGQRRLCFNGASEGTLTMGSYGDARSVHWGLQAGTLEFWCKPLWKGEGGGRRVLFDSKAYGHRLQSRLCKRSDGQWEWKIADSDGKLHSVHGDATLEPGKWHHVAATWDFPKAQLQLFIDGRRIGATGPAPGGWPFSLVASVEGKEGMGITGDDRRSMPMQAFIGGDSSWSERGSAGAAVDEFRVSSIVRYESEFAPAREEFAVDEHTRAIFHFENECHGEHHGDDRFVRGHLACELQPRLEHATVECLKDGRIERHAALVKPHGTEETFEKNRPTSRMKVYRPAQELPDPRVTQRRRRTVERIVESIDEVFSVEVKGDYAPWMRCVTFELAHAADSNTTWLPRWRANDNVVPLSVEDLAETIAPQARTDEEKLLAVFSYALDTTNYYDAHFCETLPSGRHRGRVSYSLLKALNIYPMDQCGPMNHMLRKLFLASGISSTNASGTHHQFEQAFHDGNMRLCDLSARQYWLARDNQTRIGRRQMEEDPYLKLRQGGDVNAWLRGRKNRATYGSAARPHQMDFPLRAGERVSICWHNEGRWFEMTGNREPIPLAKIPPFFGNGAVVFEPVPTGDAVVIDNLVVERAGESGTRLTPRDASKSASLVYKARCPYIFSDCRVTGKYSAAEAEAGRLSVSFDRGSSWHPVWSAGADRGSIDGNLRQEITARYAYWLKLELEAGKDMAVSGLRIRTTFVASPWALPGKLARGHNRISFRGGPVSAPVKTTCSWIERYRTPLSVSLNSLSFYLNGDGMHRNLFVADPEKGVPVKVSVDDGDSAGDGDKAASSEVGPVSLDSVPAGWSADDTKRSLATDADFVLRPDGVREGEIYSFDVLVENGTRTRRVPAQVLIADAPLVREAEAAGEIVGEARPVPRADASGGEVVAFSGNGQLVFPIAPSDQSTYALWIRARWTDGGSTRMTLSVDDHAARDVSASAMIGFSNWGSPAEASTKMFAHFGEQYGHWSWYRVPDFELAPGDRQLTLSARRGARIDAIVALPQNAAVDRAAMNLFMNWNFAPWRNAD